MADHGQRQEAYYVSMMVNHYSNYASVMWLPGEWHTQYLTPMAFIIYNQVVKFFNFRATKPFVILFY